MPYKYVVSVASKGFDEACDEILRALGRLTWATEQAVNDAGDSFLPPNELLVLGYFEDMKIGVCHVVSLSVFPFPSLICSTTVS